MACGRWRRRLLGFGEFDEDADVADLDIVAGIQSRRGVNGSSVDIGAVGGAEVFEEYGAVAENKAAVLGRDGGIGHGNAIGGLPTQNDGFGYVKRLAFKGTGKKAEAQAHSAASFPGRETKEASE